MPTAAPTGIPSAEAFGFPAITIKVFPASVASSEAFGTAAINTQKVFPTAIPSAETFGSPRMGRGVRPVGIPSAAAVGSPVTAGPVIASGIASAAAFGSPLLGGPWRLGIVGIAPGSPGRPRVYRTQWLYKFLPLVIRLRDKLASGGINSVGVIQRVVNAVEDEVEVWVEAIQSIYDLNDILECPDQYLRFLAKIIGLDLIGTFTVERQREQIRSFVKVLKAKGTHPGFKAMARIVGYDNNVQLTELYKSDINEEDGDYQVFPDAFHPYKSARVVVSDDVVGDYDPEAGDAVLARVAATPVNVRTPTSAVKITVPETAAAVAEAFLLEANLIFNETAQPAVEEFVPESTCTSACESACQDAAEVCCNAACEVTGCQTGCQQFCEATCQQNCEYNSCQTGCQQTCQSFFQV